MNDIKIVNNGFSNLVQTPGLFFCIVVERDPRPTQFAVYMRHGSPGGQFWRNGNPIRRCDDITEAQQLVDQLAGIQGAHEHFPVIQG